MCAFDFVGGFAAPALRTRAMCRSNSTSAVSPLCRATLRNLTEGWWLGHAGILIVLLGFLWSVLSREVIWFRYRQSTQINGSLRYGKRCIAQVHPFTSLGWRGDRDRAIPCRIVKSQSDEITVPRRSENYPATRSVVGLNWASQPAIQIGFFHQEGSRRLYAFDDDENSIVPSDWNCFCPRTINSGSYFNDVAFDGQLHWLKIRNVQIHGAINRNDATTSDASFNGYEHGRTDAAIYNSDNIRSKLRWRGSGDGVWLARFLQGNGIPNHLLNLKTECQQPQYNSKYSCPERQGLISITPPNGDRRCDGEAANYRKPENSEFQGFSLHDVFMTGILGFLAGVGVGVIGGLAFASLPLRRFATRRFIAR